MIRARFNTKKPGAKTKLDRDQLSRLRRDIRKGPARCGFESGTWTILMIADYIAQRFDIRYSPSSVGALVHRLGFPYRTPRPRHRKAASREEQEAFKKKARRMVLHHVHGRDALAPKERSRQGVVCQRALGPLQSSTTPGEG